MADYKVVDAEKLNADLSGVANAIRAKAETSGGLVFPEGFISAVEGIQPSSDYIKKSDTNIYTSKFACGIYRPSSETHIANVSITVGFKPKIFYMRMFEGVSTTNTTKRYVVAMIMVLDNNYAHFSGKNDGTNAMGTGGPVSVYYSSSARSDHSQGANNRFSATDTGVKGSGSTGASIYCQSGKGFQWYAWG